MNIHSIGDKIRLTLIGSICIVAIVSLMILAVNQYNTLYNQQVIKRMTLEYSIYSLSEDLVRLFNEVGKNHGNPEFLEKYNTVHNELSNTLALLKNTSTNPETKNLFIGLEHTVHQTMQETDTGVSEIKGNNIQNFSEHFSQAHKYNAFVLENTRTLLQKELEYLSKIQTQSERNYIRSIYISIAVFSIFLLFMVIYAQRFSTRLIRPLTQLSAYAKDVADGKLNSDIKKQLLIQSDEIGSLTTSIYKMVDTLTAMITQEKQTGENMRKAGESLREKNSELEKMNSIMLGRELKMIELKKEIEELKSKVR